MNREIIRLLIDYSKDIDAIKSATVVMAMLCKEQQNTYILKVQ